MFYTTLGALGFEINWNVSQETPEPPLIGGGSRRSAARVTVRRPAQPIRSPKTPLVGANTRMLQEDRCGTSLEVRTSSNAVMLMKETSTWKCRSTLSLPFTLLG